MRRPFAAAALASILLATAAGAQQDRPAYVRALAERDMSGAELAAATGRRPETVSRNLQELP